MKFKYNIFSKSTLFASCILTLLSFSACSELAFGDGMLDQQPDQLGIDKEEVFSKAEYATQVLTKAYTTLPYPIPTGWQPRMGGDMLEAITDLSYSTCTYGAGHRHYYQASYNAGSEGADTKYLYHNTNTWLGIRYAWLFIENVDNVPDMSDSEKQRAKAEAKMIIATHYADLLRHFGGFPYLDHSVTVNEEFQFPRLSFEKSVETIVSLIEEAAPHLEWKATSVDDGRMTRAYALGLKLRVLLFAASPLFNSDEAYLSGQASSQMLTWYGSYDATRWEAARLAGEEFMNELSTNGMYNLIMASEQTPEGYAKAFRDAYFTRGNSEVLLSIRTGYRNNYTAAFCGGKDNYASAQRPTLAYANMFSMADGSDFPTDFDWENPTSDPFANREPRFYETILTNDRPYKNRKSQLYVGGLDRQTADADGTGLYMYKFSQDYTDATSVNAVDSWPHLRLPEVLLSYAEAINESKGGPDAIAYEMVNQVRNRVGLPNLKEGLSQADFREALLRERACEFGYEEVRWFDIIRWKNVDAFKNPIQGVNMFKDSSKEGGYRYEVFTLNSQRRWSEQWSNKWFLSAFPSGEINKQYGLIQNPGW